MVKFYFLPLIFSVFFLSTLANAHDDRKVCNGLLLDEYMTDWVLQVDDAKHAGYEWVDMSQSVNAPNGFCVVLAKPKDPNEAFLDNVHNSVTAYVLHPKLKHISAIPSNLLASLGVLLSDKSWKVNFVLSMFGFNTEEKDGAFIQANMRVEDLQMDASAEPYEISFVAPILRTLADGMVLFESPKQDPL